PTQLDVLATVSGGGAGPATAQIETTVSNAPAPFGFLPGREGLNAGVPGEDGPAATQAGSHPQRLNVNFSIPTSVSPGGTPIPNGALDDVRVDLPAGVVVDPSVTPKCNEAQLIAGECPDATQVGIASVPLITTAPSAEPMYNLVPPPGYPAAFGFEIADVPVHALGGVRPGDYRITSLTPDALSKLAVMAARIQLWGSPSDASHDGVRGDCNGPGPTTCPVVRTERPLVSLPTSCSEEMRIDAHISFWDELGKFHDRDTVLSDANGNPTPVTGCNAVQFEPTLKARPTTNVADSPSGLEAVLHIPQTSHVDALATAHLRKAVVTLPQGLLLNPASANGLDSCDPDEVGIDPDTGVPDGDPVSCPDASRIGIVEVDTPLLEHPLPGSVYAATPFDNPFDSLLAIYVVVNDPSTNTLVKLAGKVMPDPNTGQLITTFDNNPQLPFSDFRLNFKSGPHGVLRTPATCGTYSTTSSMTPWSAPDSGPPATPKDTWSISQGPGGSCASNASALPNAPSFEAGSVSPIAGAHTPFVLNLRREDGSQNFASLNLTPPPGLLGKLAGTVNCPEEALALAATKTGNQEKQSPSCPQASEVGNVTVGAGAGPAPYYTRGKAYLAGPYKGAPLSMAVITPAAAGPYDLGTVVVRTALYIDPKTTQLRAVSDPLPQILQGIVLDVRSVQIALDRPDFTLNPTSCDPMAVSGELFSSLGTIAPLSNRFQLGECDRLGFKPRLGFRLKGGTKRGDNPKLIATLKARSGDANIAAAQVTLPRSAFLDQAHIRTICTRVQWAQDACPAGSIYGKATAISPLVDYPVSGNVYLRSSDNPLPDLVADLRGPAYQPLRFELVGRTDSVKGALRNTFDFVPDAPVSTFRLELFGGKRGLVVNSQNLCVRTNRATVELDAQSGKE
ncbi:MAG TPA: hypothetical protein VFZ15_02185, partial [Acidimicrobiia bacterium]|nr:hypothetical protein [Acidimicrobiia bacterium]